MEWRVVYRPAFLRDLARLPQPVRTDVERFAFNEFPTASNPFAMPGMEKMSGAKDCYKIRFGDFRVGIKVDKRSRAVELQRVLNRRDIYRHFPLER